MAGCGMLSDRIGHVIKRSSQWKAKGRKGNGMRPAGTQNSTAHTAEEI